MKSILICLICLAYTTSIPSHAEESQDVESGERNVGMDVVPGSVTLLEETDAHWLFESQLGAETAEDAKFMSKVDGTVNVAKDGHYSVDMEAKGRAYLVVKIDETETIRYSDFDRAVD